MGVGHAGQVEQDEGQLEGPPARVGDAIPGVQGACDRTVGGAKSVERIGGLHEQVNAAPNARGGDLGVGNQHLGRLAPRALELRRGDELPGKPGAIRSDQRAQRGLDRRAVRQTAQDVHAQFDPRHLNGDGLLHLGAGHPGRAEVLTGAVHQRPVGGDAVADGVLGDVGVVQVGHHAIPLRSLCAAQVGARHEGNRALDHNLGLEGVGRVGRILLRGCAVIDEVDRDRARAGGQWEHAPVDGDRTLDHLILEAI